jgi:hypothetical protein
MTVRPDPQAKGLLTQAAAWRLASLLLECPGLEWNSKISALSPEVSDPKLLSSAKRAQYGSEETYHRLFGPGGAVSPREVSYCGFEDPGRLMAEIQSFYDAFSFAPRREEPIDHVSVEAGFVGYLFLKQAYAEMRAAAESVKLTKTARARFAAEHVGRCAAGMFDRLTDSPAYLRKVLLWVAEKGRNTPA